jgi:hypothetical protein
VARDTFFRNGGFDESLKYAADGKLLDKIIESTKPILFLESLSKFLLPNCLYRLYSIPAIPKKSS